MKTAMILAAGRGERLRPLTDRIPKALCRVQGKPLIEHHVINLARAGYQRLVINHAYLGGQIRHHLGDGSDWGVRIYYSAEVPGGLETAGGILKALPLLGAGPFVTVNADIYTDYDFATFNSEALEGVHAVLIKKNPDLAQYGDFGLTEEQWLSNEAREYIFSGITYYNPAIFAPCRFGRYSVTSLIRSWAEEKKVSGSVFNGLWFDIGSIQRLEAVNTALALYP